jgi:hypothetical protein
VEVRERDLASWGSVCGPGRLFLEPFHTSLDVLFRHRGSIYVWKKEYKIRESILEVTVGQSTCGRDAYFGFLTFSALITTVQI